MVFWQNLGGCIPWGRNFQVNGRYFTNGDCFERAFEILDSHKREDCLILSEEELWGSLASILPEGVEVKIRGAMCSKNDVLKKSAVWRLAIFDDDGE